MLMVNSFIDSKNQDTFRFLFLKWAINRRLFLEWAENAAIYFKKMKSFFFLLIAFFQFQLTILGKGIGEGCQMFKRDCNQGLVCMIGKCKKLAEKGAACDPPTNTICAKGKCSYASSAPHPSNPKNKICMWKFQWTSAIKNMIFASYCPNA